MTSGQFRTLAMFSQSLYLIICKPFSNSKLNVFESCPTLVCDWSETEGETSYEIPRGFSQPRPWLPRFIKVEICSAKVVNVLEELVISNCKHLKSSFLWWKWAVQWGEPFPPFFRNWHCHWPVTKSKRTRLVAVQRSRIENHVNFSLHGAKVID